MSKRRKSMFIIFFVVFILLLFLICEWNHQVDNIDSNVGVYFTGNFSKTDSFYGTDFQNENCNVWLVEFNVLNDSKKDILISLCEGTISNEIEIKCNWSFEYHISSCSSGKIYGVFNVDKCIEEDTLLNVLKTHKYKCKLLPKGKSDYIIVETKQSWDGTMC